MSKRLNLNDIKNSRLRKMLLSFDAAIAFECEELNNDYRDCSDLDKVRNKLAIIEHELVVFLNNKIEE